METGLKSRLKAKRIVDHGRILRIVQEVLGGWPLYKEEHSLRVQAIGEDSIWIGYNIEWERRLYYHETTYFDLNVVWPVCYLVGIGLHPTKRGQGLGTLLYLAVEEIARHLGCEAVQMMPSGVTVTGETRRAWCLRRDYVEVVQHGDVHKILNPQTP